jgi:Sodium/hydrogen exchanger family
VKSPLFVAIVLAATSLGVIVPVLKDAGNVSSSFGQLVITGASIAEFGSIILLSLFFSGKRATSTAGTLILLGTFGLVVVLVGIAIAGVERSMSLSRVLRRLQDTTAQIRVRAAFVLLIGFTALADQVGLETILGAFAAGALLSLIDRDEAMTHPQFRLKLEAVGFGVFIPVFFVTSGLRFDLARCSPAGQPLRGYRCFCSRSISCVDCRRSSTPPTGTVALSDRQAAAGHLIDVHRGRYRDRVAARRGESQQRGSPDRRRAPVDSDLPALALALLRRGEPRKAGQPDMPSPMMPVLAAGDRRSCNAWRRPTRALSARSSSRSSWRSGRSTGWSSRGFLTLISDGEVLTGAYGLGPEAGEWMQQATLAIRARVPLGVLSDTAVQAG